MGTGGGLKSTREWDAAADGSPLELALSGLKLSVPGGAEHDLKAAIMRWSVESGVRVDVPAPPTRSSTLKGPRTAGVRLEESDLYHVHGQAAGGVRISAGYVIPEKDADEYGIPRWTRTVEGEVLHLHVEYLKFEQETRPSALAASIRQGILKCPSDLPYGEMETVSLESAFGTEQPSRLIVATGALASGYHFALRRMSDQYIQCRITGPEDGRIDDVSQHAALAFGLASGARCRWVSWREESKGVVRIFLGEPPYDPGLRFPVMRRDVDREDFKKFIRAVAEALWQKPELRNALSLPELASPPKGTYLEIIALLSAAVAEAMLRTFCEALPGSGSVRPVDPEQLVSLKTLMNQEPIASHPLARRVLGMLEMLNQVRPTDVLYAVNAASPRFFSNDEIEAWKSLRNPAAHGRFDNSSADFLRKVALVFNIMNKIVMRTVGYEGQFVDYSTMEWALTTFGA